MQTLAQLKKDLEFNRGLSSLIEVLKNLAVAQYKILEQKMKPFERLLGGVESFFELIDTTKIKHPLVSSTDSSLGVVAVTSDSGLLGGINMQVISTALSQFESQSGQFIVIGERGKMYARESARPFVAFSGIVDEEKRAQAMQLRDYLIKRMSEGVFKKLCVVYPHPVSFTVQRVAVVSLIPFPFQSSQAIQKKVADVIFESNPIEILEYLAYVWIGEKLHEIFGLSRLAEFAARYIHLEESLQKLKEMDNKLKLQYFRVRHELIDRNMRELFSARLLYSGS